MWNEHLSRTLPFVDPLTKTGSSYQPLPLPRRTLDMDMIRDPTRPVTTGPRLDGGSPTWTFTSDVPCTLLEGGIKLAQHSVGTQEGLGKKCELHQALQSETAGVDKVDDLFRSFQSAPKIPLKRYIDTAGSVRVAEREVLPYYSLVCGVYDRKVTPVCAGPTLPWEECHPVVMQTRDLIHQRTAQMWIQTQE